MVSFKTISVSPSIIGDLIINFLPEQGSVEVQHDSVCKEHAWHSHPTDETLIILDGAVRFYWEGGEKICRSGDVICLPQGERHGSVALENGATYLIALRNLDI